MEEELELEKLDDEEEEAKEDLDRPELMSMVPIPDIILLIMPSMSKLGIPPIPPIPPIDIIPPGIGPPDDIIVDDDEEDDDDLKLEVVDPSGD